MLLNKAPLHEVAAHAVGQHDEWRAANPDAMAEAPPPYLIEAMADQAFARRDWASAWRLYVEALRSGSILVDQRKCTLHAGRAALSLNEIEPALSVLGEFVESFPGDVDGLFYLGRAFQRAKRYHDALNCLSMARELLPGNAGLNVATGQIAHALAYQGFGHATGARAGSYVAVAEAAYARALSIEPANLDAIAGQIMLRLDGGQVEESVSAFAALADRRSEFDDERLNRAAINLALALGRGGHTTEILKLDLLSDSPAGERILARARALTAEPRQAADRRSHPSAIPFDAAANTWVAGPCRDAGLFAPRVSGSFGTPWDAISAEADFVVPLRASHWAAVRQLIARLESLPKDFAGVLTRDADGAPVNAVIRKRAWDELVIAAPSRPDWEGAARLALDRLRFFVQSVETSPSAELAAPKPVVEAPNRIIVLSRHGPKRLGGGEQFLWDAARLYAAEPDTQVLFAGLTEDREDALDAWPAGSLAEGFLFEDAAALRSFCRAHRVTAIHTISGLGELVLDAISGLDIRFIYGVHFWREFVSGKVLSQPVFPDVGRRSEPEAAPVFRQILARADFAYVNSDYCRDLAERLYGWRPPVLYSAPREAEARPAAEFSLRDYVLLANTRADKGWPLILDVAEALPHRQFLAVAGQTDADAARADVQHRRLFNVTVIERADLMDAIYRNASLVAVPSYAFVETFSRVAVEAGRFGKPVLLADAGNLGTLGAGTGLSLPEDCAAWIEAIERVFTDPVFAKDLTSKSVAMSRRYSHQALLEDLARLPALKNRKRILVCVGAGIGNVCHVTPMIRRLSEHFGVRVDVLVAADAPGTGALIAGAPFVASVFDTYASVAERLYDEVFVTHSFGSLVPAFNTAKMHASREGENFEPGGRMHEAEFNLDFLKRAAGISYSREDATDYFLGRWRWSPVSAPDRPARIALHAGSKDGIWASKRWPHFEELARTLKSAGMEVVSLGVEGEFVPGTADLTGLTIERMTDELSRSDALVTNDSGVMNIANAMGLPVVALFGPTNPVTRGPIHSRAVVLAAETDCAPCEAKPDFMERFQQGACRCIALISPLKVRRALAQLGLPIPENP